MSNISPATILIIDDDPVARMLVKRNFEIAGFKGGIISAEDGEQGFHIITENPINHFAIILDYHMPVLDGVGFLQKMEAAQMNHPVFILSSSIMKRHKEETLSFEMVLDYIVKPINQDDCQRILKLFSAAR